MLRQLIGAALIGLFSGAVPAQTGLQTSGTLLVLPAYGEVRQANDEARVSFMVEVQDKDKAVAAARVNLAMRQGNDLLKAADPTARLKTLGYYTSPVYAEEGRAPSGSGKPRQQIAWRVGQALELTSTNLTALPKTVAAAQKVLALNGLVFGLSANTTKQLDARRIEAAYRNLQERIAVLAQTMQRNLAEAQLESVELEPSGGGTELFAARASSRMKGGAEDGAMDEPSFEAGETTLSMRLTAKIRFK